MNSVRLFDFIAYDGDSYQVIAQDGARLALKSLEDTLWLYGHVHEIVNGPLPGPARRRGDHTQARVRCWGPAAGQDRGQGRGVVSLGSATVCPGTRRHVSGYRKDGVVALVDSRKRRQRKPGRDQDRRLLDLLREEIAAQEKVSTGTRTRVITRFTVRAKDLGVPAQSRTTLNRLIEAEERSTHPFGDATLRRTQANRPDRTYGRRTPLRPGELVEIDSTKLDLMVVFPDGTTERPELTTMIDVATMTPTAAILFPEATKGIDVTALVLARSLTPLPMQPGWNEELALSRSVLPADMIEPDNTLRTAIAARPLIYPETITIDRGKDYTGSVFQIACERLQISVIPAPPGTPTAKPHVERQFGAVHDGLIQYLRGYVGRGVNRRGEDPSAEAFWTLSQLQSILDSWLVQHWQTTPRKGLTVPAMPKKALSPNEAYAALSGIAHTPAVSLTRDDYISLLPIDFPSIQPYGVNHSGLIYDAHRSGPRRRERGAGGGRYSRSTCHADEDDTHAS